MHLIKMKPHDPIYFASDLSIAIGVVRDKTKPQCGIIITIIIKYNKIILSLSLLHQMLITAREQKVSLLHSSMQSRNSFMINNEIDVVS